MRGLGPDRRALRDRRARRRRDHQRRPGPPRAARARSRRSPRPRRRSCRARPGGRAVIPADAEALEPHLSPETRDDHVRPRRRRLRPRSADDGRPDAGDDRHARSARRSSSSASTRLHNLDQRGLRGRDRRRARRGRRRRWRRRTARISFSRLRGELVELPGGSCWSTTATTPTRSRCAPRSTTSPSLGVERPPDRGPRRDGRARPRRPGLPPRGRRARCASSASTPLVGVGELARDYAPDEWARDAVDGGRGRRAGMLGEGDAVLVKGSRAVGLEAFAEAFVRPSTGRTRS